MFETGSVGLVETQLIFFMPNMRMDDNMRMRDILLYYWLFVNFIVNIFIHAISHTVR